jgi:hypothetical protein
VKILLALALACSSFAARAQTHEAPPWFAESFLEFPQDVKEAAQHGCPACRKMRETTLADRAIVDQTRRHFVAVALNVYGERELQWTDGRALREKELARALNIRGTPTLLFLDEKGSVVLRLVGHVPPERFLAALAEAKTR